MTKRTYHFSRHESVVQRKNLIDRGANGGIAGEDMRVLSWCNDKVNVRGIDNHQLCDIPIANVAGVCKTTKGHVILVFNQYAVHRKGKSIHSSAQMEAYGIKVHDKSTAVNGKQMIETPDGYRLPISIVNGLPYINMKPPTDWELEHLPHVIMTEDAPWDPLILDNIIDDDNDAWFGNVTEDPVADLESNFDQFGMFKHRVAANATHKKGETWFWIEDGIDILT